MTKYDYARLTPYQRAEIFTAGREIPDEWVAYLESLHKPLTSDEERVAASFGSIGISGGSPNLKDKPTPREIVNQPWGEVGGEVDASTLSEMDVAMSYLSTESALLTTRLAALTEALGPVLRPYNSPVGKDCASSEVKPQVSLLAEQIHAEASVLARANWAVVDICNRLAVAV